MTPFLTLLSETAPAEESTTWSFIGSDPFWQIIGVASVIVGAILARVIAHFLVRRVVDQVVNGVKKRQKVDDTQSLIASPLTAVRLVQRTRTLGSILNNILSILIVVIALVLAVNIIDSGLIGSFALLTAALGAGLGFGAQNIVKDVLNGLFMVAEDQLGVGDVVDTGQATGVVEAVGVRITQIRDVNGTLWFVRNGEIIRIGNMSQGWARVIIDLGVPYDSDVEAIQETVLATATELATSPKWRSRIIERPEMWGIESIADDAVILRVVVKTRTTAKDDVARELRARLKHALDEQHVVLPSLGSIVLSGFEGAASVTGAKPPRTKASPVVTTEDAKPVRAPKTPRAPRAPRAPKSQAPMAQEPTAQEPTAQEPRTQEPRTPGTPDDRTDTP